MESETVGVYLIRAIQIASVTEKYTELTFAKITSCNCLNFLAPVCIVPGGELYPLATLIRLKQATDTVSPKSEINMSDFHVFLYHSETLCSLCSQNVFVYTLTVCTTMKMIKGIMLVHICFPVES